jgi:hypothetical protein
MDVSSLDLICSGRLSRALNLRSLYTRIITLCSANNMHLPCI